jgi:hypothetical protein
MARKMTTQAGGLEIEDDTYRVKLDSLEDAEGVWEGKTRSLLKWNWLFPDVTDEDGKAGELSDLTSLALSPKSKLWSRYQALTGVTLDLDMQIDLDDMIGKEAQAAIIHKPGKDGTGSWPRIENLIALPKTGRKPKTAAADQFEGFHKEDGEVDWDNFAGRCSQEGVTGLDVAKFMGVPKATGPAIRQWVEEKPERSLLGLIEQAKHQKEVGLDPDELPFE